MKKVVNEAAKIESSENKQKSSELFHLRSLDGRQLAWYFVCVVIKRDAPLVVSAR
jgi:hypothetical protein